MDLAVLLPYTPEAPEETLSLWECAQQVSEALHVTVDLVDLRRASTVFRAQVVNTGIRVYARNSSTCDAFEVLAVSMYLRFNEERRDLLDDICRTGSVFGDC